ncbi:MAG TPA: hypothetical protein VNW95_15735 [Mucilaginibacter sp.]|nr:hypothetical protein [Mucilaginibacter sp.]
MFNSKMVMMMYKQILVPDKKNHSIEMPEKFFGKKVEVIVVELADAPTDAQPIPPPGKKVAVDELFENFGTAPDFPSGDEIRSKAWPSKW